MDKKKILAMLMSILIGFGLSSFSQDNRPGKSQVKVMIAHPEVPRMPAKELVQLLEKKAEIVIVELVKSTPNVAHMSGIMWSI